MNVRRKIAVPMLILTFIYSGLVLLVSTLIYSNDLDNAMYDKVAVSSAALEREIENMRANLSTIAYAMAENQILREAIINQDRDLILGEALRMKSIFGVNFCTVLDNTGTVIVRTHFVGLFGDSMLSSHHVSAAFEGKVEAVIEHDSAAAVSMHAGVPLYDDDMNIIGVISIGTRLDSYALVVMLKEIVGSEITIFLNDVIIATTTLENEDGVYAIGLKDETGVSEAVLAGETYVGGVEFFGKETISKYVPLYDVNDNIIGMLYVGEHTDEKSAKVFTFLITGVIITLALIVAGVFVVLVISGAINKKLTEMSKKLEEMAFTDALTGIYNRRHFMSLSEEQFNRIKRQKQNNAYILLFDLDHFKKVNDTYGHAAGDKVLQDVAANVKKSMRPYDFFARYGGEEFIILAIDINEANIISFAERVRSVINTNPVVYDGGELTVSASIGVASVCHSDKLESIITFADEALYKAKAEGRNRVVFYEKQ